MDLVYPPHAHIALVANTAWSVFNFRLGLLIALRERGYEISVIAPKDEYSERIMAAGFQYYEVYIDNQGKNPLNDIRTLRQLSALYARLRPDFVIHYTIKPNVYGSWAARWNGVPSLAVTTGLGHLFLEHNYATSIAKFLYRQALHHTAQVWFLNNDDIEIFVRERIAPRAKTHLLPSEGINTAHFDRVLPYRKTVPFKLLFLGRLIWDKGIGEFVAAARRLRTTHPHLTFQVLGFLEVQNPNAVSTQAMNEWVREGIIEYLGVTADVRPELEAAQCVVLPSYYREGISRVLLEAAAMQVPIITTDNVGCREVVTHAHNGFLCRPHDANDLVDKIVKMQAMTERELLAMGENGRAKVEREFGEASVVRHYLTFLDEFFAQNTTLPQIAIKSPTV